MVFSTPFDPIEYFSVLVPRLWVRFRGGLALQRIIAYNAFYWTLGTFPLYGISLHINPQLQALIIITASKAPSPFWAGTTKVRFLGIWVSVWVGGSVANVKQPQAVLPAKNLTLTLLVASPRPILRPFCSDAIGVLWRYWAEREVDTNGILQSWMG